MSVLAHHGPLSFPATRRRHLSVVPAPQGARREPEVLADVIPLPVRRAAVEPLRLTARGRAVLAGLAILAAAALGSVAGVAVSTASDGAATETAVVTVAAGDSLWSIAASVAGPSEDVRDVMSEIASLNELDGSTLVAGQSLRVPSGD